MNLPHRTAQGSRMPNLLHDALFAPHRSSRRTFLHLPDGATLTHDAFAALAARYARAITMLGVRQGDRVAVQVEKSPEVLALYAACVMSGAALLPLNTAYTASEVAYFVGDAGPRLLVCDAAAEAALAPIANSEGTTLRTLNADGSGTLSDDAAGRPADFEPVDRAGGDLAAILYTSGTTGRSKGAMLSHDNLLSNARTLTELWRFTADDVLIHALPIFHTHGLFVAVNTCLLSGAAMVFLPRFDLDAIVAAMPKATTMMGVPTFYTRLLGDPRLDSDLTANMRLFVSGSAPLLAETHTAFEARTGHRILERYGMTETNMNTSNPYDGERVPGTVGPPLPDVEVRIVDPDAGTPVPSGDVGMIEVRGPNVFQGYWRMPEKTAEELKPDGFFITGDLGRFDGNGYVHIVGRQKDLIISGGFNIYPKEIETLLDDLPGVAESAVIGVPHPDFGEAVVAVVVPKDGASPAPVELLDGLGPNLAGFKRPKRIVVVDALPRNTMGKVQKNVLRDEYAHLFG